MRKARAINATSTVRDQELNASFCLDSLVFCSTRNVLVMRARSDVAVIIFLACVRTVGVDRHKRENMAEGAVSMIKHFQGVALN